MPEHSRSRSDRRSHALDGLRGYAAAAVVVFHTILAAGPALLNEVQRAALWHMHGTRQIAEKLVLTAVDGGIAVRIFFALSGIVLFRSMTRRPEPASRLWWSFGWRRLTRIYPVLAVCLVATSAVLAVADPFLPRLPRVSLLSLGRNLALTRFDVVGASWTLHVELVMVPLLVAGFLVCRRFGQAGGLLCLAYTLVGHKLPVLLFGDRLLAGAAPFFALGFLVEQGVFDRLARSRRAAPLAAAAAVALFGQALLPASMSAPAMLLQLASLPVLLAWIDRGRPGLVHRLLAAPLSVRLGRLSYSLYLWNVIVFELLLAAVPARLVAGHALEAGLVIGLAAIGLSLPVAALSERFLERPYVRLTGRREPPGKAVAGAAPSLYTPAMLPSADIAQG